MINLKTIWLLLLALMFFGVDITPAQKKKKPAPKTTRTVVKFEGPERLVADDRETMPEMGDLAYVVEIDENSNITVRVQSSEDVEFISNIADPSPLGKFFAGHGSKNFAPIIIVRPGAPSYWGDLLDVLRQVRNASTLKMKMEAAPASWVFIPRPLKLTATSSNVLRLTVSLDKNANLFLNGEAAGSVTDTAKLENFLKQIFKSRVENGVFRVGTNEVETTVYVKADRAAKFSDVMEVIELVKYAGSMLVGLDLDDPQKNPPKILLISAEK